MQQRGSSGLNMDATEDVDQSTAPPSRGRPTSKLKVLGRSHAMREEQSPPREPSCGDGIHQIQSPPTVVLSPSPVDDDPSAISDNGSPATLVATPNSRCSPHCESNDVCERLHPVEADLPPSPKYLNGKHYSSTTSSDKTQNNKSSQIGSKSKRYCDCQNQNCIKCLKDRGGSNINNNHSNVNNNVMGSPNMLYVNKSRGKLRQQSSSQTSFESSTGNSPCLSRDSSSEFYTDTTGVDLEQFIPDTINKNPKDRALMLRIEEELIGLVNDKFQTHYKFPPMTSYHRMLVHRCAAYFGMDHNIDQTGKCIVVNKTKNTRLPDVRFKEHVKEIFNEDPPRRSILKRDSNSIEDYCFKSPERGYSLEGRRSKSFEEREEEYERARRRIFRGELHDSSEDFGWADMQWSSTDSDYSRYRLQPPEYQSRQLRRLLKVHSEEAEQSMRPCVAKSYSFGGYGGSVSILSRGDSVMSTHSAPGPRILTKQDSGASSVSWRLSPSSSGYKSQSQMSESVTPSPTSTPHPPGEGHGEEHHRGGFVNKGGNPVVWAVTDLSNVPKGSIIIDPETGKPYKNDDGTIYYYDPVKPAPGLLPLESPPRPPEKVERPPTPQREKTPISSPKHELQKISPKQSPAKSKSCFTNTATSPSLPFSPPLSTSSSVGIPMSRSYPNYLQVVNSCENVSNLPQQQHFAGYSNAPADGNVPVYPQPYVVYTAAPYSVPVQQQYDGRLDQSNVTEISTTYYVPESAPASAAVQTIAYQTQPSGPFWNQQAVSFYPNAPQAPSQTPPQRYSVQMPAQGQAFAYPTAMNYVATQPTAPQSQNPEIMPVYQNQPAVQMMYPQNQPPNGTIIYQNQPSLIYAHSPAMYPAPAYSTQAYPQSTPTPNSVSSSVPTTPFDTNGSNGFVQLSQNLQHMSLGPSQACTPRGFVPVNAKCSQPFDPRRGSLTKTCTNSFASRQPRPFLVGSSQSSTGTNSPAATVVPPGYCPAAGAGPPAGQYRTPPPSTPPTPQFVFSQPGYPMAPRLFRQMSGERGPTPVTAKGSRSPTPAGDVTHFERQRFTFPPNLYHGMPMPYIVQSDPRLVGRGQPNVYRQATPPMVQNRQLSMQGADNRSHNNRSRKPKVNRAGGLPPTGK